MAFGNALAFPFHRSKLAVAVAWTPANLFLDGEAGGWYDPTYQAEGDSYPLWQTVAAEDEADAVGDPIGLYLSNPRANEEDFSQAASAARPTLGTLPKGVGIANRLRNTEDFSQWTGGGDGSAAVTLSAGTAPDGTNTLNLLTDDSTTQARGRGLMTTIPADTKDRTFSVYAKAGTSSVVSVRVVQGGGVGAITNELVVDLQTGNAQWHTGGGSTSGSAFSVSEVPDYPGIYRIAVVVTNDGSKNTIFTELRPAFASTYSPTLGQSATGDAYFWGAMLNDGNSAESYQRVNAPYDITQDGVPSILMPYYDGGDYLSLGKPALSDGCSFFADASQKWAVGGAYCTLAPGSTMFSCTATGTGKLRVFLNSSGLFGVICRATATGVTGTNRADGKWRSWLLVWDGAVLRLYLDNIATPITVTVGTDAEQPTAVPTIGVNNPSSPVGYFNGFNDLLLMRSGGMTPEQIEHWREYVNDKYGVV